MQEVRFVITVMIVEDDPIVRGRYRDLIDAQPDMRTVALASNGAEACRNAPAAQPDVVIMDLHMPSMDGVEATRAISSQVPSARVLVVTVFDGPDDVQAAVRAGAAGFLLKNGPVRDLLRAVRLIQAGQGVLSPEVTGGVMDLVRGAHEEKALREVESDLGVPVRLTQRESEMLQLIAMGKSNEEIAGELFLAPASVKTYVSRLRAKLKARSRAELVTLYYVNSRIADGPSWRERRMPAFGARARGGRKKRSAGGHEAGSHGRPTS